MPAITDLYGRPIGKGDHVVLQDPKNSPFIIVEDGAIALPNGNRVVKCVAEITFTIPATSNAIPAFLTMDVDPEKTLTGSEN